jgi:ADP-ribose pyrophosphatase
MDGQEIQDKFRAAKKEKHHQFKGSVVDFSTVTYTFKDGSKQSYDLLEHPGAGVIVPIDENGDFVMIKQFRHPISALLLEFPAGRIDPGETPLECARREMQEEIKMIGTLEPLIKIMPAAGYNNERLFVYLARNLKPSALPSDENEEIEVIRVPVAKARQMVIDGEIEDAKTIIAILLYASVISGHK